MVDPLLKESQKNLAQAIRLTQRNTKRNAENIVKFAAISLCQSGRRKFKKNSAKTRREVTRSSYGVKSRRATRGADWIVTVLRQNKPTEYLTVKYKRGRKLSKKNPPIKPENIGLAWRSWGWLLRKLPGNRRAGNLSKPYRKGMNTKETGYVNKSRYKSINPTIMLTNKLTYLELHKPGLSSEIINSAANKMKKKAESNFSKVKAIWR